MDATRRATGVSVWVRSAVKEEPRREHVEGSTLSVTTTLIYTPSASAISDFGPTPGDTPLEAPRLMDVTIHSLLRFVS